MRWFNNFRERWADFFRVLLRAILTTCAFMGAVFAVWFTARFLWRLHELLEQRWFSIPWTQ